MEEMWNFPFGQIVEKVEQTDKTPKKVFVLGVYASAVHAKWIDAEGKLLARALAVASETRIFWDGNEDEAKKEISKIILPKGAGKLYPADKKFNGPSGIALDEFFLEPIKLKRKDCWLCDLIPYSMINPDQEKTVKRNEKVFQKFELIKQNMRPANVENRVIDDLRRKEIFDELKKSQAEIIITLGDEPIQQFINPLSGGKYRLDLNDVYGIQKEIVLDGKKIKLLPLVHPRQAAKLGRYSKKWNDKHEEWKEKATKPRLY